MLSPRYNMKMDRRVKWITATVLVAVVAFLVFFIITSGGTYLPGWFTILILALLTLLALSIPRFMNISENSIEIHCVMELTTIPIANIKSVSAIEKCDLKWCVPIPLLGVWGIFGYYGYYFDLKNMKLFKIYAKVWDNFIRIEDIYEDVVVVSTSRRNEIIAHIKHKKGS